ncbi:hypothetical protein J2Z22_000863 [Paenibacillus forsythiae]|uniref:Uncharacterized protein n=2 Tax=Paenibacillus forsythiae TaxID=365616 RepID=A0ABU3H3F2_9BACL|nr:hypothetical protein [Paenibacillus forsythiae]MDT3425347.1 hypothetical protein [Paenibacillus forsythiae]
MKKKGAFFAVLFLALATMAANVWALPNETHKNESTPKSSVYKSIDNASPGAVITPQVVGNSFHYTAGGSTSVPNSFVVPTGYGHLKLYMVNHASSPVSVSLTHIDSGKVYFTESIAANAALDWRSPSEGYPKGMRGGNYVLQWRSSDVNVNGEVWGICGSRILLRSPRKSGAFHA